MSGWGDFPHWEQLVRSVRGAYNNLGDNHDFTAVGRKLWDLPNHLDFCAPSPGSGLVVAGPPFFHVPSAAGHDWSGYILDVLKCLVACQYRLSLVLLLVAAGICALLVVLLGVYCWLFIAFVAISFEFASDNPGAAVAFAVLLAAQRWREFDRDRGQQRVEQREREQQQRGQERYSEHHQPDGQLKQRQPRKQR